MLMTVMNKHKHSSKPGKPRNKARNFKAAKVKPKATRKHGPKRSGPASGQGANAPYWLFGTHAALAATSNPARHCLRIVLAASASPDLESEVGKARQAVSGRPDVERLERAEIEALLPPGAVHQGLAVLAGPLAEIGIEDIVNNSADIGEASIIVLDQATDLRNIGAVMRSAAAFGALAVVVQDRHAPHIMGTLCKAASGAVERVPLVRAVNLARAIGVLKNAGFWAAGLDPQAGQTLAQADLSGRVVLVLGAEGRGLRRLTCDSCDQLVKVPINKSTDSLNLSNAAAIALYELSRQRT